MSGRVDDPLDIFQTCFTVQGKRINGMLDRVTQAGHFVEFSIRVKGFGRTDFGAGRAVGRTGIRRKQRVCFDHRVCDHCTQSQKRAVLRMIRLAAPSETAQTGIDGGVLQRHDAPRFKLMKNHRGIAGNGNGQMTCPEIRCNYKGRGIFHRCAYRRCDRSGAGRKDCNPAI